eukprot:gene9917-10968_t
MSMIIAKALPEILERSLGDGLEGLCLMTVEGNVFCSSFASPSSGLDETTLAAIGSAVWSNYSQGVHEVYFHLAKLDEGYLGICSVGKQHIIAGAGRVAPGLLRLRLQSLAQYYNSFFEQVK